jgi:hypothetical protein
MSASNCSVSVLRCSKAIQRVLSLNPDRSNPKLIVYLLLLAVSPCNLHSYLVQSMLLGWRVQ